MAAKKIPFGLVKIVVVGNVVSFLFFAVKDWLVLTKVMGTMGPFL
jgi:hypothetical protein